MRATLQDHHGTRRLLERLAPGLDALCRYDSSWLRSDIAAGLSVAAIALPVGIAYAGLARVPVQVGMYAAIFPLFAYALFGSSRQLMIGPDAATCMMMAAALGSAAGGDPACYGALVTLMTLFVGVIYLVMGFARLGFFANFLSMPILVGFLNGVAVLIIAGQLGTLLGVPVTASEFLPRVAEVLTGMGRAHAPTAALGVAVLAGLVASRRLAPRVPGAMVAVLVGIALCVALDMQEFGVAVVGRVPGGLPEFGRVPDLPAETASTLVRDAAGLALVRFTSGILTARSFALRNRYEIDANRELKRRLLMRIAECSPPVEWVVVDASPVNVIDSTALKRVEQLIDELAARGIVFAVAHRKIAAGRMLEGSWVNVRGELTAEHSYPTIQSAVDAIHARQGVGP